MHKATFIRAVEGFRGDARLYRLTPTLDGCKFVIVSATSLPFIGGCETFIFPASSEGEVTNWGELDGSYKGGMDHIEALKRAGYSVV